MTEEEAKTKPCIGPEGCGKRATEYQGFGTWGVTIPERSAMEAAAIAQWKTFTPRFCIGSACMAWRWHYVEFSEDGQRRDAWPDLIPFGPPDQLMKRHAYCGLAGDPPPIPPNLART